MAGKHLDYNASIIHQEILTEGLGLFRVRPDEPIGSFIPGQYAVLGLNHGEKGSVMRAYSIASAPQDSDEFYEFYIRLVMEPTSDNPLTHLVWDTKIGDRIYMRPKIAGHFTIPDTMGVEDRRLRVFVAAGTGLAPFLCMVKDHHNRTGNPGNHAIIHGVSYPADLGYRGELEKMMNGNGRQLYLPTISRLQAAPEWTGLAGRACAQFEPGRIERLDEILGLGPGGLNPANCTVMICGLTGTIAGTLKALFHRGFVPADRKLRRALGVPDDTPPTVFFEQYDAVPILDTKDQALMDELAKRLMVAGVALEREVPAQ